MTATDWTAEAKGTGQYAEVNGINLYYETHRSGRPLADPEGNRFCVIDAS